MERKLSYTFRFVFPDWGLRLGAGAVLHLCTVLFRSGRTDMGRVDLALDRY